MTFEQRETLSRKSRGRTLQMGAWLTHSRKSQGTSVIEHHVTTLYEGLPPPCSSYSQSTGLFPLSSLRESFSSPSNVLILATLSNLYLSVGEGKTTVMWLRDMIF